MQKIKTCTRCSLYQNQPPLLGTFKKSDVFFVGLSAKLIKCPDDQPLDINTPSGQLIHQIEQHLTPYTIYKTNLVKCAPLDLNQKLRYPTTTEMNICATHLDLEIKELQPKIIFLLGKKVEDVVLNY